MPIDPALAPILDALNAMPQMNPPYDPAAIRAADEQPMPIPKAEIAEVRDVLLNTTHGDTQARLYHPQPGRNLPVLVFFHGGGWVGGTIDTHDPLCRAIASASDLPVISVAYPLSPENRFPVAINLLRAALNTIVAKASELGIDASRIALGGDSAGGNLAAALALSIREHGGPDIAHQLLFYPVIDNDFTRASYAENATGYMLTSDMMQWFWAQYLGDANAVAEPLAAPIRAESLAGLPSATIITAELDPLRDEGVAYAQKLEADGVKVQHITAPGVLHGFASMLGMLPAADRAVGTAAGALRAALGVEEPLSA